MIRYLKMAIDAIMLTVFCWAVIVFAIAYAEG